MKPFEFPALSNPIKFLLGMILLIIAEFAWLSQYMRFHNRPVEYVSPIWAIGAIFLFLNRKKLTWLEVLVVLMILVILSAILMPTVMYCSD